MHCARIRARAVHILCSALSFLSLAACKGVGKNQPWGLDCTSPGEGQTEYMLLGFPNIQMAPNTINSKKNCAKSKSWTDLGVSQAVPGQLLAALRLGNSSLYHLITARELSERLLERPWEAFWRPGNSL